MRKYDETQCVRDLNRKHDCRISGRLIEVSKDNGDVGKKSWAKIDYLCKVHGYRYMITSFAGVSAPKRIVRNIMKIMKHQRVKIRNLILNLWYKI